MIDPMFNRLNHLCRFSSLDSPGNINITSTVSTADNCVYKQGNLTCTADANPPAEYEWLDLICNSTTTGAVKSIASCGQYQCTAFNSIRSQRYNITKTVSEVSCCTCTYTALK